MKSLLKLKPYLSRYKSLIFISLILAIPIAIIRAGPVPLIKYLIDDLFKSKDPSKLLLYPLYVIGLFTINFVIRFFHYYCMRVVIAKVNQDIKNDLYNHVMGLSTDYFTAQTNGSLISKVGTDPNIIDQGVAQISSVIREPATLVILLGYTIHTNWKLTLITIGIFPPLAWIFSFSGKALKRYIHRLQEEQSKIFSTLQESFSGFRVIQFFKLEPYMQSRFFTQSERFTKALLKTAVLEEITHPSIELITSFAIALLIYFGGKQVISGSMTDGDFFAFFGAFALMLNPIRTLNDINIKLNTAAGACERVFHLFETKSNLKVSLNPKQLDSFKDQIELKNVEFYYPDAPERKILDHVSFSVKRGQSIALVGASGAGKSSLISLLPRLFDVTGGSIEIDGVNINEFEIKSLRDSISVVSQDVFLFNDTVAENIRCGRLDATDEEIRLAAKHAFADDFIEKMPDKYLSIIGDRGQKLSGGERQRLSIARAFLRKSPILILDEATSSLDTASEKAVQKALESLMQNRTTILIAHRLSTIRNVDCIYVLKEGKIVEQGSHQELQKSDGEYSKFLRMTEHLPS